MKEDSQILKCYHCGNETRQYIKAVIPGPDGVVELEGLKVKDTYSCFYFVTKCQKCSGISLYWDWDLGCAPPGEDLRNPLYPSVREFEKEVPSGVATNYDEARKIKDRSPISFAVMARRILECICVDKQAKGSDLKLKIEDLAKRDIIPSTLARMANAIRFLGNAGAHVNDLVISKSEADILDYFLVAVIEYVYIAPIKLEKLVNKIKRP